MSLPGVYGRGVALINQPHLAPRLKKEYSYTSTPPLGLTACSRVNFRFTFSNVFFFSDQEESDGRGMYHVGGGHERCTQGFGGET